MESATYQIHDDKVIIRLKDRVCDTSTELITSALFRRMLQQCISKLERKSSKLLKIFETKSITDDDIELLVQSIHYLCKIPAHLVPDVCRGSEQFLRDPMLLYEFIEYFYNYWRQMKRLIVCDSFGNQLDKRPYRTFNATIERLTHLIRGTYRDIQENLSGVHPRIYRQVPAGAATATIALPKDIPYPEEKFEKLNDISIIRQTLTYPPLIINTPMNKRKGMFERVYENPLDHINIEKENWLCYPAKVGDLIIMVYFSMAYYELGFALSNLFELADDEDLEHKPDAIYLYGTPEDIGKKSGKSSTIFYDDEENDLLIGAVPESPEFSYFGYLKKMMLTLHNIKMMKNGKLPFHGALVNIGLRDKGNATVLLIGDSGAGKSETLEALRMIGEEEIDDLLILADDMGSLRIDSGGYVIGIGTEIGAFVRLDDLQPGFAFGQIDRTIIMNPSQVNARVVIPITSFNYVIKGYKVDYVFYANNYDEIDEDHPIIEPFQSIQEALHTFREGTVMSKGTTTTTGLVHSYFANIFGPPQYRDLHEKLAEEYFKALFDKNVFVGEIRTRLSISGYERSGPEESARELLRLISKNSE
ncbi:MAG: hypothetical protein JEZ06_18705 [Anaerolineaceae bacterium]|nr:hypothetical protein [Anaerolineaceae bacterium]